MLTGLGDRPGRTGSVQQAGEFEAVGVSESGLVAADRAQAGALFDAVTAFLDDAIVEHPRLEPRVLEIDIRCVDLAAEQAVHQATQLALAEPGCIEQGLAR